MNEQIEQSDRDHLMILTYMKREMSGELESILAYWLQHMVDKTKGGFYGRRLWDETLVPDAPKSAVLNTRILWTFSAAFLQTQLPAYAQAASRTYQYITSHFVDTIYGGIYWSVNHDGSAPETRKQVYAQSFAIYALSEYYQWSKDAEAKELSIELFELLERHSRDRQEGGYIEAFTREWGSIDDLRLSEKDANEKKTMNTHLHVLEAYTNLYRIHPVHEVRQAIIHLLEMFDTYIIDPANHHLVLFFDEHWNRKGAQVSYGHDIEAAWLLCEAAEVVHDKVWMQKMHEHAVQMVDAAIEGLDKDAGLWHEWNPVSGHMTKEKHWWPQAEAMVGFLQAWQLTRDHRFLEHMSNSWDFIKTHLKDEKHGEWIWGIKEDGSQITSEDKVGFWKGPYHNGRACLEIMKRLS